MKQWQTKSGNKVTQLLGGRSNVFLLTHNKKNIIIDTSPKRKWKKLNARLKELNITHLDYLVLTHTHFDHADNARRVKDNYKAKVFVHKSEAGFLTSGGSSVPSGTNLFTRVITTLLAKQIGKKMSIEPCSYDYTVDSSYDLSGLGFNAYIMHTPGHSPGSMSVIVDDEIALVGDTMFGVLRNSVFPPFAADPCKMIESWRTLLETGCSIFLPSHGREKSRLQLSADYKKYRQTYNHN